MVLRHRQRELAEGDPALAPRPSLLKTWMSATSPPIRTRHATAGPSGRSATPMTAGSPSTVFPLIDPARSVAIDLPRRVGPDDLEQESARYRPRVTSSIDRRNPGPASSHDGSTSPGMSCAIVSHSSPPANRHMTSCDTDAGATPPASRLNAF